MRKRRWVFAACLMLLAAMAGTAQAACEREEDHRYGSWKTKTSATCTRQGHQFRYCRNCDHWEQRYTAKLPHTPGEMTVTQAPTCTEKGREEGVCTVCGRTVRRSIDKLPHAYGEMTVTREPTCTADGRGEYTCATCGRKKAETIDALGHDWGETVTVKAPTCKASGTGEQTCLRCGRTRTVKIDRLEHVWGDWTVTREPEGARRGERTCACTLCGRARSERFYPEGTLYEDMEPCEDVIAMQEKLRDLGYYKGSIRSGTYGELTSGAVARFQKEHGLSDHGVADGETLAAITAAWEAQTGKTAVDVLDDEEMEHAEQAQTIGK